MRYSVLLGFVSALFLCACDPAYLPSLGNNYGAGIELTITYANGDMTRALLPACARGFLGMPDTDVVGVTIAKNGQFQSEFGADEIRVVIEKQKAASGYSSWIVGPAGTALVFDQKDDPCYPR